VIEYDHQNGDRTEPFNIRTKLAILDGWRTDFALDPRGWQGNYQNMTPRVARLVPVRKSTPLGRQVSTGISINTDYAVQVRFRNSLAPFRLKTNLIVANVTENCGSSAGPEAEPCLPEVPLSTANCDQFSSSDCQTETFQ
jgi:hypothetical protein